MSGVWIFKNGIAKLVANPLVENVDVESFGGSRRKVLVHCASNLVISNYKDLGDILESLGWEIYPSKEPDLLQYHKTSTPDLISLPADFSRFKTIHMYDIVVKNRSMFEVRDATHASSYRGS